MLPAKPSRQNNSQTFRRSQPGIPTAGGMDTAYVLPPLGHKSSGAGFTIAGCIIGNNFYNRLVESNFWFDGERTAITLSENLGDLHVEACSHQ
ncbi:MAG: hypothetical protein WBW41_20990 [Verrucomicrobiia bacterium]